MNTRSPAEPDVTGLLQAWGRGEAEARDRLVALVYEELRRRAAVYVRREHAGHVLQPTALVHEVYLRLVTQDRTAWQNRDQFFGIASQMMRRVLVDAARARGTGKRSGQWSRVTLDEASAQQPAPAVDILDLDRALDELAAFDPRKSQVAEQRFFGGMSLEESADVLGISVATVERDWQAARAWLHARLSGNAPA